VLVGFAYFTAFNQFQPNMKHHFKKATVTVLLLGLVALCSFWGKRPYDGPEHKNLQVLPKDIKQEKLKAIMDGFCSALNVKCGFCHVRNKETNEWDYAADTKGHKKEARDMMKMTNDLNVKYFGVDMTEENPKVAITCYTCHRGEEHPVFAPKPAQPLLDSMRSIKQ
jgi:hypothetical protein